MIYEFASVATLVALAVIVLSALSEWRRRLSGLPPGPIPLPVIGNLHQMGRNAHTILMELGKQYGDVMRISLGPETAIVVSGIDACLEGLVQKGVAFAGRPLTYTLSLTSSGGKGKPNYVCK